jgi:hypothetical protein
LKYREGFELVAVGVIVVVAATAVVVAVVVVAVVVVVVNSHFTAESVRK